MLTLRHSWLILLAITFVGCANRSEVVTRSGTPESGKKVTLCDLQADLGSFVGDTVLVSGYLYGGPHGTLLTASFGEGCGVPLDATGIDAERVSDAMSVGRFSWVAEDNPWVHVTVVGRLQHDAREGTYSLVATEFLAIEYCKVGNEKVEGCN